MKHLVGIYLALSSCLGCGGEAFGTLIAAPDAGVDAEPLELVDGAPALVMIDADAGDPPAVDAGRELGPDASPVPAADASAGDDKPVERDAAPDVDEPPSADSGEGEGSAPSCSNASECPACGSAVMVACCTAGGRCGCAYSPGPCR